MGLNPLHFNGVYTSLMPDSTCSDIWMQYAWQDGNRVSREDIARAIHDAEQQMARYIGYNLLPDWTVSEYHTNTRPAQRELYNWTGFNQRGQPKSLTAKRGYVVSGGIKAKTLLSASDTGVSADVDGDGYAESLTFTVATTVDPSEIHAYHIGHAGDPAWEIRPVTVTSTGILATITLKIWQLVNEDLWEALNATGINGDTLSNFMACGAGTQYCIDIYRVYNDPQTQVQFLWETPQCGSCGGTGCTSCQLASQYGCLTVRDQRLGIIAYTPATWNATTAEFDAACFTEERDPDRLRLWYYSGWRDEGRTFPTREMDRALERAVAYYATALLDRPLCTCEQNMNFAEKWKDDLALSNSSRSFQNSNTVLDNPFGTTRGAVYAWRVVNEEQRRLARQ